MTQQRPYSPETLANRWGCSAEKIRRMVHSRQLASFRLGKLIRIPAAEVERFECQQTTPSEDTEENSQSSTPTTADDVFEGRLARQIGGSPRLELVSSGPALPLLRPNG